MKHVDFIGLGLLIFSASAVAEMTTPLPADSAVAKPRRQEVVSYAAERALESFSKTVHGGVMHVVAKSEEDTDQIRLIQDSLKKTAADFSRRDFSTTEKLHGTDMPGLRRIKNAGLDDIRYEYKSLPNGAQIHFSTEYPELLQALHEWLDAQSKDHGDTKLREHEKHHSGMAE